MKDNAGRCRGGQKEILRIMSVDISQPNALLIALCKIVTGLSEQEHYDLALDSVCVFTNSNNCSLLH